MVERTGLKSVLLTEPGSSPGRRNRTTYRITIRIIAKVRPFMVIKGVRVVWKNEKLESFKLESFAEVGKSQAKLKEPSKVGKNRAKLERTDFQTFQLQPELSNCSETFQLQRNFPTKNKTFQLRSVLSNFARFFPTSIGSFQLRSVLSNFAWLFPTSAKLFNFRLSNFKLSNFSFFPTALSNYTHPHLKYLILKFSWLSKVSNIEFLQVCFYHFYTISKISWTVDCPFILPQLWRLFGNFWPNLRIAVSTHTRNLEKKLQILNKRFLIDTNIDDVSFFSCGYILVRRFQIHESCSWLIIMTSPISI